jgi:hypothetical protein
MGEGGHGMKHFSAMAVQKIDRLIKNLTLP